MKLFYKSRVFNSKKMMFHKYITHLEDMVSTSFDATNKIKKSYDEKVKNLQDDKKLWVEKCEHSVEQNRELTQQLEYLKADKKSLKRQLKEYQPIVEAHNKMISIQNAKKELDVLNQLISSCDLFIQNEKFATVVESVEDIERDLRKLPEFKKTPRQVIYNWDEIKDPDHTRLITHHATRGYVDSTLGNTNSYFGLDTKNLWSAKDKAEVVMHNLHKRLYDAKTDLENLLGELGDQKEGQEDV